MGYNWANLSGAHAHEMFMSVLRGDVPFLNSLLYEERILSESFAESALLQRDEADPVCSMAQFFASHTFHKYHICRNVAL